MRRKIGIIFILTCVFMVLVSCKPSNKYTGEWYAVTGAGAQIMIDFSKDKTMTIDDGDEQTVYEINQYLTGFHNKIRYFGIEIDDEKYFVIFEDGKDEENATFLKQTNVASDFEDVVGDVLFLMNRNEFPSK